MKNIWEKTKRFYSVIIQYEEQSTIQVNGLLVVCDSEPSLAPRRRQPPAPVDLFLSFGRNLR